LCSRLSAGAGSLVAQIYPALALLASCGRATSAERLLSRCNNVKGDEEILKHPKEEKFLVCFT